MSNILNDGQPYFQFPKVNMSEWTWGAKDLYRALLEKGHDQSKTILTLHTSGLLALTGFSSHESPDPVGAAQCSPARKCWEIMGRTGKPHRGDTDYSCREC